MTKPKETTREGLPTKSGKIEPLNRNASSDSAPKKKGGVRPGSGPKPSAEKVIIQDLKAQIERHATELTDIVVNGPKGQEIVKKTRVVAIMDMLVKEAVSGKNIAAAKEYLDRALGKSVQPLQHSGEIHTHEQRLPEKANKALLAAQTAFHRALQDEK